jgi:acetyl-CoA carboxylase biotin carboxyl carrier protein
MDFENIKELIKLVDSSNLAFFELTSGNDHIKMDKSLNRGVSDNNLNNLSNASNVSNVDNINAVLNSVNSIEKSEIHIVKNEELKATEKEIVVEDKNISIIKSPMVGTFYSSASPESPAFAGSGDAIPKGKVICIIEAMKLMNEIESEYSGVIVERLVNDGDMVEYGQPLFKIKGE